MVHLQRSAPNKQSLFAGRTGLTRAAKLPCFQNFDHKGADKEGTPNHETIQLSEGNTLFVWSSFSSTLSNTEQRRIRKSFPTPRTPHPKLDSMFKSQLVKAEFKSQDNDLRGCKPLCWTPQPPYCISYITWIQIRIILWWKTSAKTPLKQH